ncbi:hypothetical protein WJX73_000995 [Symbiochloris irregularis]|uniref:uroporphyrinogen-III C-methyltransferase n=1 Tax=Symbiochloris irregularis TaxID=706552 RepID=A0AAW1PJX1_9CHLO
MLARQLSHAQAECSSTVAGRRPPVGQVSLQRYSLSRPQARHVSVRASGPERAAGSFTAVSTTDAACPSADRLLSLLRKKQRLQDGPGEVHLVGTGPGDAELLTLRAVRLMQSAEVVLYDRLVSHEILDLVHKDATMVYVGKEKGFHTRTQTEIHELLCSFAQQGKTVLRLKGGDPYIFGRGGEEVEYLQHRGITVHCVPGISAASGISADLGIPLTHRGSATSVRFVTGHLRKEAESLPEAEFMMPGAPADPHTTLVVYMGLSTLPTWSQQLQAAGLDPDTPAAAIERGTTPQQRAVYSPLAQLATEAERHGLKSPTLVIVGPVVGLAPGWAAAQALGESLREGRFVASGGVAYRESAAHIRSPSKDSIVAI